MQLHGTPERKGRPALYRQRVAVTGTTRTGTTMDQSAAGTRGGGGGGGLRERGEFGGVSEGAGNATTASANPPTDTPPPATPPPLLRSPGTRPPPPAE